MPHSEVAIPSAVIEQRIYLVRGHKIMLDRDLAELYGVPAKALNQAVKRNAGRFPDDFMFQLTRDEAAAVVFSRSQNVTLKRGENLKYAPYAFTEQGVAMLASVLNSDRAVQVSIAIIRVFVRLRAILGAHRELARRLNDLEARLGAHDQELRTVFKAIRKLMAPQPVPAKRRIGFIDE